MGKNTIENNTQAVILCGGAGTRLHPLTYDIPKPMVPINGKPFLHYQIDLLKNYNITNILLLIGYLGQHIRDYFGDGKAFGARINYSVEETLLGTGGALKNADSKLDNIFILLNGDTFLPINYADLANRFIKLNCLGLIVVYDNSEKIVTNNIAIDRGNIISAYNKKNEKGMTHVDAGVAVFKKEVLEFIPERTVCSLEEEIFQKLISKNNFCAYPTSQRFYDMGSFKGLDTIRRVLK